MWDLIVSVPDHCLSFYFVTSLILVDEVRRLGAWNITFVMF